MSNLFFSQNSENRKFKSDFPPGKDARKIFDGKDLSDPKKLSVFSKKDDIEKNDYRSKNLKNTESINEFKRFLRAFNQELSANFECDNLKIFESYFPL